MQMVINKGGRGSHGSPVVVLGKDSKDGIGDRVIATGVYWLSHSEILASPL